MRFLAALFLVASAAAADDELLWIRYPAISPDGERICFSYRGDLWLVPAAGGVAVPFTTHVGYERSPVWSRDGARIAFASDRHGNFDVFVKELAGGAARRLTFHSGHDVPSDFSPDGKRVLFSGTRAGDPKANPAGVGLPQLHEVTVAGGRPRLVLPTPALNARWNADGTRIAYEDYAGRENKWRKHHTSSVARDVWIFDVESGGHTRYAKSTHEDRNPVWAGVDLIYLCEESGSFNVHGKTKHETHPVRFLSRADDGTLCYGWNGAVYRLPPGGEPRKVAIRGRLSDRRNRVTEKVHRDGATGFAVSPDGKEVAFVVRGELFAASVEHGTTRRLTDTPVQERSPDFAPDGKTIYFAAERGGSWNLYSIALQRPEDKYFFRATALEEKAVLESAAESFQPKLSPDGKRVAFLHERDEIRVLDLASGNAWTVVPADRNYSYADGDIGFDWSPDSKWLAFRLAAKGRWIDNIGVADVEGERVVDMTRSGYWESAPRWSRDGTALVYASTRLGRRSHGSWGSDADVFAMRLTQEAMDGALLSVEEHELGKPEEKKDGKEDKKKEPPPEVEIEFEGRDRRVQRLTLHSAPLAGFALSPDGEILVSIARVGKEWALWETQWRKGETRRLMKLEGRGGDVVFGRDGEAVFVRSGSGGLFKVELKGEPKPVKFAAAMEVDAPAERAYIFAHAWRQLRAKFYDPKLHGVDWPALRAAYEPFLAHIDNNHDFAEMLSELLGELNASHTGCYYRIPDDGADETASLGLLLEPGTWKVAEVLEGGPCAKAGVGIAAGAVLTAVNGVALEAETNLHAVLNRKAGKRLLIAFRNPNGNAAEAVVEPVKPREEYELRYRRWVKQRRELTDRLSKGRIGYVHVRGMGEGSFRHLYAEALGRFGDRDALIVDTRNNGGGWLHDDLVTFLGGTKYAVFHPRGKRRGAFGEEPFDRWSDPVAVLVNEANYSDAHIFPYAFQKLGIGPVVGAPVAGTGTAVWWERQIDPTLVFGIPQVGIVEPGGTYVENQEFVPDHVVLHPPEAAAKGEDPQLEKAVAILQESRAR